MPAPLQLVIDLPQLGPHPFRLGLAPNPEPPLPPGCTDVRETEEGERLRLTQPARPTTFGRVASEFDQPCLVRVKLQTELGEPVAKRGKESVGVVTMLKPDGEVVSEAHDNDVAARLVVSPPIDPQVEDVVGSPRGFSPRGSHGTERDTLASFRSSHPVHRYARIQAQ